jgi:hypothetical protein
MNSAFRDRYEIVAWVALLWAVGNAAYVYLLLGGDRTFRVESAAYILVAVLLPLMFWHASSPKPATALTTADNRILMALTVGLWFVTLVPYLTLPFLSDDYVFLASYRHFADVFSVGHFFRPMFGFAFVVFARIGNVAAMFIHLASA